MDGRITILILTFGWAASSQACGRIDLEPTNLADSPTPSAGGSGGSSHATTGTSTVAGQSGGGIGGQSTRSSTGGSTDGQSLPNTAGTGGPPSTGGVNQNRIGDSSGQFTSVSVGDNGNITCGVKVDQTIACWNIDRIALPGGTFNSVSVGLAYACGVRTDGSIVCWGDNGSVDATPLAGTFTSVSLSENGGCGAKTDGTVACWGGLTPPAGTFTSFSVGRPLMCGVKSAGTIACFSTGDPTYGCYDGTLLDCGFPPPAGTFTSVSAGQNILCGVKTDGTIACWGDNDYGQAAPPGGICECCLKFFQRWTGAILVQEQVAELFARRNNRPRCCRKLLDCILLIGCRAHQGCGFIRFPVRMG